MIYFSTGFVGNDISVTDGIQKLISLDIKNIELSGGKAESNLVDKIIKKFSYTNFILHNYFPPSDKPFVINLASMNKNIISRSINHIVESIKNSVKLKSKYYSFHSGFLFDLEVTDLGYVKKNKILYDRKNCLERFIENVNYVSRIAEDHGIDLLIENNVLNEKNYNMFDQNPFLMVDSEECERVMNLTPINVNLLIDVGHLNVSSSTLNFDKKKFLSICDYWIKGYHFSENDGITDSNNIIKENSWFLPFIKKNLDYYCIEVYKCPHNKFLNQIEIIKKYI